MSKKKRPPKPKKSKEQLRADTRDAARVLIEDIAFIRTELDESNPRAGHARRISAILRRLLVNGELNSIASPRVGRLMIRGPWWPVLLEQISGKPFVFLVLVHALIYHCQLSFLMIAGPEYDRTKFDPTQHQYDMSIDRFLGEPCVFWDKNMFSRKDMIDFTANVGSGVHTGEASRKPVYEDLQRIRYLFTMHRDEGDVVNAMFNPAWINRGAPDFLRDLPFIDLPALCTLATAYQLSQSPMILELEKMIRAELQEPNSSH